MPRAVKRAGRALAPSTPGRLGDSTMETIDGDWQAQWMVGFFIPQWHKRQGQGYDAKYSMTVSIRPRMKMKFCPGFSNFLGRLER